jgi:hypothetical protein
MAVGEKIHNMFLGPSNLGFMQEKVQKGDFIKKPLRIIFILGSYETLEGLEL